MKSSYERNIWPESCPRFVALAGDDYIDADDELETLIGQLVADGSDSDVAVWDQFDSLAAVVLADGTVHRFAPQSAPAPRIRKGAKS